MAKLLLWGLTLGCFSEAAKRCASTFGQKQLDKDAPKRRKIETADRTVTLAPEPAPQIVPTRMLTRGLLRKNVEENLKASQFIMSDILGFIVCKIIEDFPLRPASDPVCHLASVSQQWHAFFKSKLFWNTILMTPNAALYVLLTKKTFSLESGRIMFMSAKALLLEEEQLDLIVEVSDPVVMIGLGELSYERPADQKLSSLYQQLRHIMPAEFVPKGNWKKAGTFDQKLEVLCTHSYELPLKEYALIKMGSVNLIRLFYLQDLLDPTFLNWLYSFFPQQVCQMYHRHPEFRPKLAAQMQELSRVILPRSLTSLVFECMCYPIFLAILVNDFDFLRMVGLDYAVLEELYAGEERLLEDIRELRDLAEGSQKKMSFAMIDRHHQLFNVIIERGTHGFSVASIKEALGEITVRANLDHDLFVKIQKYISSE